MTKKKRFDKGGGPRGKAAQKAEAGRNQAGKMGVPPAPLKKQTEQQLTSDSLPPELRNGTELGNLDRAKGTGRHLKRMRGVSGGAIESKRRKH